MKSVLTAGNRRPRNRAQLAMQKRRQRGVALIEALIAVLIFSFGVLGLIGLESAAINISVDAEDRNRAIVLANDIASAMWLNDLNGNISVLSWQTACTTSSQPVYLPNCAIAAPALVAGTTNTYTITITWVPNTDTTNTLRTFTTQVTLL
jgi:type IV pilus assembly protein PilV